MSVILIVFLLLGVLYASVLHRYHFTSGIILFESSSFFLFHALFALILNRIHKYYHSRSAISIVHLSTVLFFVGFYLLFIYSYASLFFDSQSFYRIYVSNSFIVRGLLSFLFLLAVANQFWIDKHLLDEDRRHQALLNNEKRLIQAELNNLKQQFQPHFLFNSLNSISALVGSQPQEARRMILLLSEFLRHSVRKREQDFESLEQELEFMNLYLEIEKVRFGHRLQIDLHCDELLKERQIPSQVLQPLVENAVKYGLYGNLGALVIGIEISETERGLKISIKNPYEENAVNASKGTGYGIQSIGQKLKLLYGRTDLIKIDKKENEFEISITIP